MAAQAFQIWLGGAVLAGLTEKICNRVECLQGVKQGFSGVGPLGFQVEQGAALACQLGPHHIKRPLAAKVVVQDAGRLCQAHGSVVVLWPQNNGDPALLARAEDHGRDAGFGQFHQHAGVEPGLRAVDDAAVYQLDRHGATALAVFVNRQGFTFGFNFQVGAVKQQQCHGVFLVELPTECGVATVSFAWAALSGLASLPPWGCR